MINPNVSLLEKIEALREAARICPTCGSDWHHSPPEEVKRSDGTANGNVYCDKCSAIYPHPDTIISVCDAAQAFYEARIFFEKT